MYYGNALKYTGEPVKIQAVALENTYYSNFASSYNIIIKKINGKNVNYKTKLMIEYPCDINYNEIFTITVTLSELEDSTNGFPFKLYNISKGYVLSAVTNEQDIVIYRNDSFSIRKFLYDCNNFCVDILKINLNQTDSQFANAVLLGNQNDLSETVLRDMRYLGLSHITSVSGMHFSILMGSAASLLGSFKINKSIINVLLILFSVFFMGITGFSPSVTRSALMFIIYTMSFFLRQSSDAPTSLFASVSLICLINPYAIYDIGLMMSFSATFGILTLGTATDKYISGKIKSKNLFTSYIKKILSSLNTTTSAVIFTLPLTWANFGILSVISPITNLLVSIPVTIILSFTPLLIIFNKIPPLLFITRIVISYMCKIFYAIVDYFARFYNLAVSLNYDFVVYVFIILCAGVLAISLIKRIHKNPLIYFIPVVISIIIFSAFLYYHNAMESNIVRIIYITDKSNEAFVIKYDNRAMICDVSDGSYGVTRIAENLLADVYNVFYVDTYMLTHYHQRHISTIYNLSQNSYLTNLIIPEPITETDKSVMSALMEIAEQYSYTVTFYPKSEQASIILFDDLSINIMQYTKLSRSTHPVLSFSFNTNTQKVAYFGKSVFESRRNTNYLNGQINNADIIVFGQHGPILKHSVAIDTDFKYLRHIIFANDEIKQAVNELDIEYAIHNQEHYYSEVAFYVH